MKQTESFSLNVSTDGTWLHVLPAPPAGSKTIKTVDGRQFQVSDLAAIVRNSPKQDILLDRDHDSERFGGSSAAYGWGDKLEVRASGLWMHTTLTALGREAVEGKLYKYLSPVLVLGEEREVEEIVSVALTNTPALRGQLSAIGDLSAYRARNAERVACSKLAMQPTAPAEGAFATVITSGWGTAPKVEHFSLARKPAGTTPAHSTGAERAALKRRLGVDDAGLDELERLQDIMRRNGGRLPAEEIRR